MDDTLRSLPPPMALALAASFGSVERWREEFAALGQTLVKRSGRLLLVFRPVDGKLAHQVLTDPMQTPVAIAPLLVFDSSDFGARFEPAFAADAVVEACIADITWGPVYLRYQQAVHHASEPFGATADEIGDALVIDVRRAAVFEQAGTVIPGSQWRDPAMVSAWAAELPAERALVVYCVYGHEVGRSTALRLRAAGLKARYLRGGIDGWQTEGRPLQTRAAAS